MPYQPFKYFKIRLFLLGRANFLMVSIFCYVKLTMTFISAHPFKNISKDKGRPSFGFYDSMKLSGI